MILIMFLTLIIPFSVIGIGVAMDANGSNLLKPYD